MQKYRVVTGRLSVLASVAMSVALLSCVAALVHALPAAAKATQVTTGGSHACAVVDNWVKCWGYNNSKQLGIGTLSSYQKTSPVTVEGGDMAGKTVTKVSAGYEHTCAVASAQVFCWGDGGDGRLGTGSSFSRSTPQAVQRTGNSALKNKEVIDVAAGYNFTCALASDGTVACWGANDRGQLGTGNRDSKNYPVAVSIASTSGQSGDCIKKNFWGFCTAYKTLPPSDLSGQKVKKLATLKGIASTMCVITVDGRAVCWGQNFAGQAGNGDHASGTVTKDGGETGRLGNCSAVYNNNSMTSYLRLDAEEHDTLRPKNVQSSQRFDSLTITAAIQESSTTSGKTKTIYEYRSAYTTGKTTTNSASWWGGYSASENRIECDAGGGADRDWRGSAKGEITYTSQPTPQSVGLPQSTDLSGKLAILSGNGYTGGGYGGGLFCAVRADSVAFCDANGSSQLSEGQTGSNYEKQCERVKNSWGFWVTVCQPDPTGMQTVYAQGFLAGKTIKAIDTGTSGFTCVIAGDDVGCWGENGRGQLGTGDTANKTVPTKVTL